MHADGAFEDENFSLLLNPRFHDIVQYLKELLLDDGLHQVIRCFYSVTLYCKIRCGRQKDNICGFVETADFFCQLHAGESGHDDIQQIDVIALRLGAGSQLEAAAKRTDGKRQILFLTVKI